MQWLISWALIMDPSQDRNQKVDQTIEMLKVLKIIHQMEGLRAGI